MGRMAIRHAPHILWKRVSVTAKEAKKERGQENPTLLILLYGFIPTEPGETPSCPF